MGRSNGSQAKAAPVDAPAARSRSKATPDLECGNGECTQCRADWRFITAARKPRLRELVGSLTVVDLFSGCGGMSVGLQEAARRAHRQLAVRLAVDHDDTAAQIYKLNFPEARVVAGDVGALFDGVAGQRLTKSEKRLATAVGRLDVLVGGPPCQGHSDLNNHTRRKDPRNSLYGLMARAAKVLNPKLVVVENVAPVQWDKGGVVDATWNALYDLGYEVAGDVIDLRRVGVPQRRRRHVLIASRVPSVDPEQVLEQLTAGLGEDHADRTVWWAIEDLRSLRSRAMFDSAPQPTADNEKRIKYLFAHGEHDLPNPNRPPCHRDDEHSYRSMYGRLWWDEPAQTITTGFGSMGQGRYVHPSQRRTITPHEAARLQTFPDWFSFGSQPRRAALGRMIGNAVPPLLMAELGRLTIGRLHRKRANTKTQTRR